VLMASALMAPLDQTGLSRFEMNRGRTTAEIEVPSTVPSGGNDAAYRIVIQPPRRKLQRRRRRRRTDAPEYRSRDPSCPRSGHRNSAARDSLARNSPQRRRGVCVAAFTLKLSSLLSAAEKSSRKVGTSPSPETTRVASNGRSSENDLNH
jgi:hypothetical protein